MIYSKALRCYFSENASFNVENRTDRLIFDFEKISIPIKVSKPPDISKLLADYLMRFPDIGIFNDGHADAYFSTICEIVSDASTSIPHRGDFGFPFYQKCVEFNLNFSLHVIKKTGEIENIKITQSNKIKQHE